VGYRVGVSDILVTLCSCQNIGEAYAIRASLEARGVPTLVDGEHQRGMLGLGSAVALRIMVPRAQLRLAYELALEIISDLPQPEFGDEAEEAAEREPMPLRRALPEDLLAYPEDQDTHEQLDDDGEDDMSELRARRTLFGPRLGFAGGMFLAIFAIAHGNLTRGFVLAAIMLALAYLRVLPLTAAKPDS
jgi:hypothetical protein